MTFGSRFSDTIKKKRHYWIWNLRLENGTAGENSAVLVTSFNPLLARTGTPRFALFSPAASSAVQLWLVSPHNEMSVKYVPSVGLI